MRRTAGLNEQGLTIVELLVGFLLVSILLSGALLSFRDATSRASDNEVISSAEERAREILEMMAFDLRTAGAGMPLGQSDFAPGGVGLGAAPLPVLLNSTATQVVFRINPRGRDTFLTADFSPSLIQTSFSVEDASFLNVGDTVYITDASVGDSEGLQGVVSALAGSTVSINASYSAASGAILEEGSILSPSDTVTYESNGVDDSIHRIDRNGDVILGQNASFTIEYLDETGAALSLPLTNASVQDELAAVRLNVSVDGERALSSGATYTAVARQAVHLRNLNIARNSANPGSGSSTSSSSSSSSSSTSSSTSTSSSSSSSTTSSTTSTSSSSSSTSSSSGNGNGKGKGN